MQLEWGAHAPSRAVFRALAEHTGARTTQPFGVCLRLEATGEGAARNTRGRVCSPKVNCMDTAKTAVQRRPVQGPTGGIIAQGNDDDAEVDCGATAHGNARTPGASALLAAAFA